jgi:hypothetical protein
MTVFFNVGDVVNAMTFKLIYQNEILKCAPL